jgi:hypothetical protein
VDTYSIGLKEAGDLLQFRAILPLWNICCGVFSPSFLRGCKDAAAIFLQLAMENGQDEAMCFALAAEFQPAISFQVD